MRQLYILYEHAAGYALFRTKEFEEIAAFLPQVQSTVLDVSKFRSVVFLMSYQKFPNSSDAVENMKDIAQGVLPKQLQLFLENNVPKSKIMNQAVVLGVQDSDLANAITETLGITCITSAIVTEITRGIRTHFQKLVKGFKDSSLTVCAELALGHHYSRSKVNFSQTRMDNMISGTLNLLEELEMNVKNHASRLKLCYSVHFPELRGIISDDTLYTKCVSVLGNRLCLPDDVENKLMVILNDSSKVQNILATAKKSMGMEITETDLENINFCTDYIFNMIDQYEAFEKYLKSKMQQTAPNLCKITGELVAAQLISRAGGLMNLAKLPSTTVQVLGAQKALFRQKRTFDSTKFGILSGCDSVAKMKKIKKKLNVSKLLANKCALASRTDCFVGSKKKDFSQTWLQAIDDRIKFLEKSEKIKVDGPIKTEEGEKVSNQNEISLPSKNPNSFLERNDRLDSDNEFDGGHNVKSEDECDDVKSEGGHDRKSDDEHEEVDDEHEEVDDENEEVDDENEEVDDENEEVDDENEEEVDSENEEEVDSENEEVDSENDEVDDEDNEESDANQSKKVVKNQKKRKFNTEKLVPDKQVSKKRRKLNVKRKN